ncbi:YitT family protein [Streptococcus sp. DD13]|uniref:YitT family protein n=1 Tax=Streptococcus sp. DD13 TaxID=1777881 RepID=UPI00079A5E52|nr:YitT family protein [Streptococcus sp. DD13]KXT77769.1 hypothetical protein STRDD13_01283 [Streptococcus sp. DD13]
MKQKIKDFSLVTIGSLVAALGYNSFLVENQIASGGISGLAVSMKALFGWNPGNFVMILAVPLLLICWIFLGKDVFIKTFYGSFIFPFFIRLTENIPTMTHQPLLASLFGGFILGVGLGLVFFGNSSTGGTGIITQILHKYTPLPLGVVLLITDGIIVGISAIAFDMDIVMYSIISLIVVSFTIDAMMTGLHSSRNLLIISKKEKEVRQFILEKADRGVTQIPIKGGYSGYDKWMLMTTLSTHELPKIQATIQELDPTAFMVIMPATKVIGRGFSLHKDYRDSDDDFLVPM